MREGDAPKRWPGWVYDHSDDPDYRFSFANERTFLAWIRTSLALVAAGVAIDVVDLPVPDGRQRAAALTLIALGLASAAGAWVRWALAERAIRRDAGLPSLGGGTLVVVLVVTAAALLLVPGL